MCVLPFPLVLTLSCDHMTNQASELIRQGVKKAIKNRTVTYDFKRLMPKGEGKELKCSEFGKVVVQNMDGVAPGKPRSLW